jgi:hypothetical protein
LLEGEHAIYFELAQILVFVAVGRRGELAHIDIDMPWQLNL